MKTYEVEFSLNVGCSVTVEAESPGDAVERVTQMSDGELLDGMDSDREFEFTYVSDGEDK